MTNMLMMKMIIGCLSRLRTRQTPCRRNRTWAEGRTWRWTRDIWPREFWPVWWRPAAGGGRTDPLCPARTPSRPQADRQHLKHVTQPLFKTENGRKGSRVQMHTCEWLFTAKKISHRDFKISKKCFILTKESVISHMRGEGVSLLCCRPTYCFCRLT